MLPLIRTAWIINRRLFYQFSPWLIFYLASSVVAQRGGAPLAMAARLVAFPTILTIIITLQGLFLPVEEFILSLPVSRSQIVLAKYLSSLLGLVVGLMLPLLTVWLGHLLAPVYVPVFSREALGIQGLAVIYLAFGSSLFLPCIYQFGPEKGSTFFSMTFALFVAGCLAWKGIDTCIQSFMDFSRHIMESRIFALAVIAGVLAFGLISLSFSIWTYRQKVAIGGHPLSISKIRAALHL
jgi:hypothetical protein